MVKEEELIEVLRRYLDQQDGSEPPPPIAGMLDRLRGQLQLSEEEQTLLKLRYIDGVNMKTVVKLLNLQGDPYKRYSKILRRLNKACRRAGLAL